MLTVMVEAFSGVKDNKVKVGEREAKKPDSVDEAIELYGAERVLKGFWKSEVIAIQASIRTGSESNELIKAFKALSPEEQLKALNNRAGRGSGL